MGKKRNQKKGVSSYKPQPKHALEPVAKRQKTTSGEVAKFSKPEFKVTPEMFEAARVMKTVAHVKDLDVSLVKRDQNLPEPGMSTVTTVNLKTKHTKQEQVKVSKPNQAFDFNSKDNFNTETDSTRVAQQMWDYFLNPISAQRFMQEV